MASICRSWSEIICPESSKWLVKCRSSFPALERASIQQKGSSANLLDLFHEASRTKPWKRCMYIIYIYILYYIYKKIKKTEKTNRRSTKLELEQGWICMPFHSVSLSVTVSKWNRLKHRKMEHVGTGGFSYCLGPTVQWNFRASQSYSPTKSHQGTSPKLKVRRSWPSNSLAISDRPVSEEATTSCKPPSETGGRLYWFWVRQHIHTWLPSQYGSLVIFPLWWYEDHNSI